MNKLKLLLNYFSKVEIVLWCFSTTSIIVSFCIFDKANYSTLLATILGITSIILNAKGNPLGQLLMIIFSFFYGIISYQTNYYGEMITYLGMTMPMAVFSLISWLKNPYNENKLEVKINYISRRETVFMLNLTVLITIIFYFILNTLNTANMIPSTLSVTTSFIAVYLTFRRNPYFSIAYAANDIILIILWSMMTTKDITYFSVVICFVAFLINDIYGYINWCKMAKRQNI